MSAISAAAAGALGPAFSSMEASGVVRPEEPTRTGSGSRMLDVTEEESESELLSSTMTDKPPLQATHGVGRLFLHYFLNFILKKNHKFEIIIAPDKNRKKNMVILNTNVSRAVIALPWQNGTNGSARFYHGGGGHGETTTTANETTDLDEDDDLILSLSLEDDGDYDDDEEEEVGLILELSQIINLRRRRGQTRKKRRLNAELERLNEKEGTFPFPRKLLFAWRCPATHA